jgi:DAK2 domain fusion protein YloV
MDLRVMDGLGFFRLLAAGVAFVKKYRSVLNELNVFPVPDGDTGNNMMLTLRSAVVEAGLVRRSSLAVVAEAAARGSLMGARGNSGVIVSQMLRGFAHHLRHREQADAFLLATALREAVSAAKQALVKPVAGTIISVAEAAADAAYHSALHEPELYRFGSRVVRAANEALERTPDQLPALREAGVVDAGGAGFVYFLEGILRYLPENAVRATAFPRRPERTKVFGMHQRVGEHKYCTEFVLEEARCSLQELRDLLSAHGESLLVIGTPPTLKVHIHTDAPVQVTDLAGRVGRVTRAKVDDMERQHNLLVVPAPSLRRAIVTVVPGEGFARIVAELGADVVVRSQGRPSVRDLLLAVNKAMSEDVLLLVNDGDSLLAARTAVTLTAKRVRLVETRNVVEGIGVLLHLAEGGTSADDVRDLDAIRRRVKASRLFLAARDAVTAARERIARGTPSALFNGELMTAATLSEVARQAVERMGAQAGGLVTLYYGGSQKEKDAVRLAEELQRSFPAAEVEYYYGGMPETEYWVSFDA